MIKLDEYEQDILESYEKGEWVSTATVDLSRFKASATATLIKIRQTNIPKKQNAE